ncbi:YbhB/YbcL family Raf kinase inhibitor-like protein [Alsobacter soli]|nr:YbhB/YbcL family Raf kinase inhibitor-like protein [Alsobacter soli]
MSFFLTSPLFTNGQAIPKRFTRFGENISPPLIIQGAPEGTRCYALLVEDTDASNFVHWGAFDFTAEHLPEGAGSDPALAPAGLRQVMNGFGRVGYDGPQPPGEASVHNYYFRLLALPEPLGFEDGCDPATMWTQARARRIAEVDLIGLYMGTPL